jgi:hypothetical protein
MAFASVAQAARRATLSLRIAAGQPLSRRRLAALSVQHVRACFPVDRTLVEAATTGIEASASSMRAQ